MNVAVDTLRDSRQVKIVPCSKVSTTAIVAVRWARVRGCQGVGDGLGISRLYYIDISVGRVGAQVSSSKKSADCLACVISHRHWKDNLPCGVDHSGCIGILIGEDRESSILRIEVRISPAIRDTHVIQLLVASNRDVRDLNSWIAEYWLPCLEEAVVSCGSELSSLDLVASARLKPKVRQELEPLQQELPIGCMHLCPGI